MGEMIDFARPGGGEGKGYLARVAMTGAGLSPEIHRYEGAHAFFNETLVDGPYDRQAAELSWQRSLEFLDRVLA